jgi:uncharacterized protein (TIGR02231 family)
MRHALIAGLLLASAPAWAAEISTKASVSAATVFPDGATVTRIATFTAEPGRHTLVLTGVPVGFDTNSLRASGSGNGAFSILSVEERAADPAAVRAQFESEAQKIRNAIEQLEDQRTQAENQIAAADRQLAFIDATIKRAGVSGKDSASPTAQDWVTLWSQSNASAAQALDTKLRAEQIIRKLDRQIDQLEARASTGGETVPATIAVEIDAAEAVTGQIEVQHFTYNAAWGPVYDARLDTEKGALTLIRRAAIQQRTGEPWSDEALTLSTARPTGGTAAPEPRGRIAQLRPERRLAQQVIPRAFETPVPAPVVADLEGNFKAVPAAMNRAQTVSAAIRTRGEALVYDIPARADIPGSGVIRQVLVGEQVLDATQELRATPSQDTTAYLYALFDNGAGTILPGDVALTRDGLYIGKGRLPLIAGGESGAIPFGALETLKITYRVVEQKAEDSFASADQTERRRYAMSAENLSDTPRTVVLRDSVPVSNSDEVEVEVVGNAPTDEDLDDVTGRVGWEVELAAGEKREIEWGYDVSYPLGRDLILR